MRQLAKLLAVGATAALALTACSGSSSTPTTPGTTAATTSAAPAGAKYTVGLAYDIGGRGDKSFNDSAAAGLDKASAELGVKVQELEATQGETDDQKAARLRLLAQAGDDPVIAVGFAYAGALKKVAAEFPNTHFAIIDDSSNTAANIANLVFAEQEGSYLVGAIAAQASKKAHIGFIGGVDIPLIHKFQAGFEAGAKAVNPAIKIEVKYLTQAPDFSGFGDPAKGKTAAQGQLDAGADVVYHAAGGSGAGVFQAVAGKGDGNWAIGVDSDQYLSADPAVQKFVLTSMIKHVDVAVYTAINAVVTGAPLSGTKVFDLSVDGVGYSTSNSAVSAFTAKADDFKKQIIAKTITVPEK